MFMNPHRSQASDRGATGETQDHEHPESDPQAALRRFDGTRSSRLWHSCRRGLDTRSSSSTTVPDSSATFRRWPSVRSLSRAHFEPEFFRVASPFLADGGVFFDVGANVGLCSFGMIAALGETRAACAVPPFRSQPRLVPLLDEVG